MNILGIETSCDETAAAVVENGTKIISNVIASSAEMHAKTGGIIPEQAARQQVKSIIPVIDKALKDAKLTPSEIDTIAVTYGPGLIGSLLVGVETAKTLSYVWNKPIVNINHLVAHIYANWLENDTTPQFPALALVVSGGHTDLVLMKDHGKLKLIGSTKDDAAGEAFDKTARLLGLPYPGGPEIAKLAIEYLKSNSGKKLNLFPRPLAHDESFDWSFSGLKTAVLREVKGKKLSSNDKKHYAAEIQEAIVDVLVDKTMSAVVKYKPKSLLLSGGVAANTRLKEKLQIAQGDGVVKLFLPNPSYCTDNGAVIASCAFYNNHEVNWEKVTADPSLTIIS